MHGLRSVVAGLSLGMTSVLFAPVGSSGARAQEPSLAPATMPKVGTVDERFQSYNVEMLEVTGGAFWKPYKGTADAGATSKPAADTPAGMDPTSINTVRRST